MKTIKRVYNLSTPAGKMRKNFATPGWHTHIRIQRENKSTLNPVIPSPLCPREVLSIKPNLPTRTCFFVGHTLIPFSLHSSSLGPGTFIRLSATVDPRYVRRTSHFCLKLSTRSSQLNRQIYCDCIAIVLNSTNERRMARMAEPSATCYFFSWMIYFSHRFVA